MPGAPWSVAWPNRPKAVINPPTVAATGAATKTRAMASRSWLNRPSNPAKRRRIHQPTSASTTCPDALTNGHGETAKLVAVDWRSRSAKKMTGNAHGPAMSIAARARPAGGHRRVQPAVVVPKARPSKPPPTESMAKRISRPMRRRGRIANGARFASDTTGGSKGDVGMETARSARAWANARPGTGMPPTADGSRTLFQTCWC